MSLVMGQQDHAFALMAFDPNGLAVAMYADPDDDASDRGPRVALGDLLGDEVCAALDLNPLVVPADRHPMRPGFTRSSTSLQRGALTTWPK